MKHRNRLKTLEIFVPIHLTLYVKPEKETMKKTAKYAFLHL
jgi:hypothetical protein